jgi:predicted transcriptional regulator
MHLRDILKVVKAQPLTAEPDLNLEVRSGFASDLMSDVLRYDVTHGLLVTGLANPQIVRTAEVADLDELAGIIVTENKPVAQDTLAKAEEEGLPILTTPLTTFEVVGRLWEMGVRT